MALVGQWIVLSVDEPYDYVSQVDSNLIEARIVAFDPKRATEQLVAETDQEVVVPGKARGTRLIMEARHHGAKLSDVRLGIGVIVGVAIVEPGKTDDEAIYSLIGGICLKGRRPRRFSGFR